MIDEQTITIPIRQYLLMLEKPSLRDQFAIAALTGMLKRKHDHYAPHAAGIVAYQYADAMLEARKEKNDT